MSDSDEAVPQRRPAAPSFPRNKVYTTARKSTGGVPPRPQLATRTMYKGNAKKSKLTKNSDEEEEIGSDEDDESLSDEEEIDLPRKQTVLSKGKTEKVEDSCEEDVDDDDDKDDGEEEEDDEEEDAEENDDDDEDDEPDNGKHNPKPRLQFAKRSC